MPDEFKTPPQKLGATVNRVANRPVVAVLAAAVGFLGGATLTSPTPARTPNVDILVHQLRILRPLPDSDPTLEAYTTSRFTFTDGGTKTRDNGTSGACRPVDAGTFVIQTSEAIAADCGIQKRAGWPHVIELRLAPDGSWASEVYWSQLRDGGVADQGRVICNSVQRDVPALVSYAVSCSEPALDQP